MDDTLYGLKILGNRCLLFGLSRDIARLSKLAYLPATIGRQLRKHGGLNRRVVRTRYAVAMTGDLDGFEELEQELRESVGGEFRRQAEEDEYATRKGVLRNRSLDQVAYELLARGDTVAVLTGERRFLGVVAHANRDLLTLVTPKGDQVHVNLGGPIVLQVAERAPAGGKGRDRFGPESFLARMRELELSELTVEIVAPTAGDPVMGRIEAAATDHLMVISDSDALSFIPLAWVAAVIPR